MTSRPSPEAGAFFKVGKEMQSSLNAASDLDTDEVNPADQQRYSSQLTTPSPICPLSDEKVKLPLDSRLKGSMVRTSLPTDHVGGSG